MHDMQAVEGHSAEVGKLRTDEAPSAQFSPEEIDRLFQAARNKTGKHCRQLFEEAFAEKLRRIEADIKEELGQTFFKYLHDIRSCPQDVIEYVQREIAGTNPAQAEAWFS